MRRLAFLQAVKPQNASCKASFKNFFNFNFNINMNLEKFRIQAIHFTLKSNSIKKTKDILKSAIDVFTDEADVYDFKEVEDAHDVELKIEELCSGGVFNLSNYQKNKMIDVFCAAFDSCT